MLPHWNARNNWQRDVGSILVSDTYQEPSAANAALARRIRAAREAAGLTQQQVAEMMTAVGFSFRQGTISKIEAVDSFPRPVLAIEARQLAVILGVTVEQLIDPADETELQRAELQRRRVRLLQELSVLQVAIARVQGDLARTDRDIEEIQ
jgi:transcriptional regulator with XRE-family HTH domain